MKKYITKTLGLLIALTLSVAPTLNAAQPIHLETLTSGAIYTVQDDETNFAPFSNSFHVTAFVDRWSSAAAVPTTETVTVIRDGRVYRGSLQRQGQPVTVNGNDASWGATFAGIVTFTGITQGFSTEFNNNVFEIDLR